MRKLAVTLLLMFASVQPSYSATLNVCVKRLAAVDEDFTASFQRGPIRVPAGAVFDYAGHAFGPASDPRDERHQQGSNWIGISKEEAEGRDAALLQDVAADQRHKAGLVTLAERVLTRAKPCAEIPVAAAASAAWGWTISPVSGTPAAYYQLYGVIRSGQIDTSFHDDRNPLDYSGTRGALNGVLSGTTDRNVRVPD